MISYQLFSKFLTLLGLISMVLTVCSHLKGKLLPSPHLFSQELAFTRERMIWLKDEQRSLQQDLLTIQNILQEIEARTTEILDKTLNSKRNISKVSDEHTMKQNNNQVMVPEYGQELESLYRDSYEPSVRSLDGNHRAVTIGSFNRGGNYQLISNVRKIELPKKSKKCRLAILISSGPYSGGDLLMAMSAALLQAFKTSFRGFAIWNFHAHANMNDADATLWLDAFHRWLSSLSENDSVIIGTPFFQEDGEIAKNLCRDSVTFNSLRSLEDIALFRRYGTKDTSLPYPSTSGDKKWMVEYIRKILFHQKKWRNAADLTVTFPSSLKAEKSMIITRVLKEMCEVLHRKVGIVSDPQRCEDLSLFLELLSIQDMIQSIDEMESLDDRLEIIKSNMDDVGKTVIDEIHNSFYHWISSE